MADFRTTFCLFVDALIKIIPLKSISILGKFLPISHALRDRKNYKFHMVNLLTCMNVGTSLEKAIK